MPSADSRYCSSQTGHSSIDDPDSVVVLKALHAQLDDPSFDEIRQDIFSVRAPSSGEPSFLLLSLAGRSFFQTLN